MNACSIHQSKNPCVPGNMYSIPALPGTKVLVQENWAVWIIVSRWVWDSDMQGALAAEKMSLCKMFTLVAVAMRCKVLTAIIVEWLLATILSKNTLCE